MRLQQIRKNKGITLIALVITIIVLLILAGISINAIFGQNGLISRAQESKVAQQMAEERDWITLALADSQSQTIPNKGKITNEILETAIKDVSKLTEVIVGIGQDDYAMIQFPSRGNRIYKISLTTGEISALKGTQVEQIELASRVALNNTNSIDEGILDSLLVAAGFEKKGTRKYEKDGIEYRVSATGTVTQLTGDEPTYEPIFTIVQNQTEYYESTARLQFNLDFETKEQKFNYIKELFPICMSDTGKTLIQELSYVLTGNYHTYSSIDEMIAAKIPGYSDEEGLDEISFIEKFLNIEEGMKFLFLDEFSKTNLMTIVVEKPDGSKITLTSPNDNDAQGEGADRWKNGVFLRAYGDNIWCYVSETGTYKITITSSIWGSAEQSFTVENF